MLAIAFLLISSLFGWALMTRLLPHTLQKDTVKIPLSVTLGSFIAVWIVIILNIFLSLSLSFTLSLYILLFSLFLIAPRGKNKGLFTLPTPMFDYLLLGALIVISILLMNQSLHFTGNDFFQMGSNEWGDFDMHLPLIRSFAWGANMPPALSFFPNANASYHFMFAYWSALLEIGGLPLSYAFNIPSILAMSMLLFLIYKFTTFLFPGKKGIGILPIIFFLFNSTLGFIEAYQKLSPKNLIDFFQKIIHNGSYLSVGPYTSDHVSIIWNMNVYLNQRHLIFGFALGLCMMTLFWMMTKKHVSQHLYILLGFLIGLLPMWDVFVFLSLFVVVSILSLLYSKNYKFLSISVIAGILAFPQLLWLSHDVKNYIQFNPGFLAPHPLTISGVLIYWIYNLGVSIITIPLGFFLANKEQRQWFIAIFAVFILGNLVQFDSAMMINNHKLFNFWIILSNCLTALVIWTIIAKKTLWRWGIAILLLFFLTFSGVIDMFVVANEHFYTISDYNTSPFMQWVANATPQNAIFLVPSYTMYDQIRMSGRKIFVPDPRFAELGYDYAARDQLIQQMYSAGDRNLSLSLLQANHISYIELPKNNQSTMLINTNFYKQFPVVYSNNDFSIVHVP